MNSSIHEALPVSFLEALSFIGYFITWHSTNPDDLTSKFWYRHVGEVPGNGFDKVDLFVNAVRELIEMMKKKIII